MKNFSHRLAFCFLVLFLMGCLFLFPRGSCDAELGYTSFSVVCLGGHGGLDQSDMTSYVIKARGPRADQNVKMVQLDMGTSLNGIQTAAENGAFKGLYNPAQFAMTDYTLAGFILVDMIQAYLVTHPHLDHTAGLVISAPDDTPQKPIYGTDFTTTNLQDSIFNWVTWPDFSTTTTASIGTYSLTTITDDGTLYAIPGTQLHFQAYPLVHGSNPGTSPASPYPSTAYLISTSATSSSTAARLLFFGDTGPDSVQNVQNLRDIWEEVAQYVVDGSLLGIMLECSYTNSQPANLLFGHLNPFYFMEEMDVLYEQVVKVAPYSYDAKALMQALQIVVIHIKPSSLTVKSAQPTYQTVMSELEELNSLKLNLTYLQQGDRFDFGSGGSGRRKKRGEKVSEVGEVWDYLQSQREILDDNAGGKYGGTLGLVVGVVVGLWWSLQGARDFASFFTNSLLV